MCVHRDNAGNAIGLDPDYRCFTADDLWMQHFAFADARPRPPGVQRDHRRQAVYSMYQTLITYGVPDMTAFQTIAACSKLSRDTVQRYVEHEKGIRAQIAAAARARRA